MIILTIFLLKLVVDINAVLKQTVAENTAKYSNFDVVYLENPVTDGNNYVTATLPPRYSHITVTCRFIFSN